MSRDDAPHSSPPAAPGGDHHASLEEDSLFWCPPLDPVLEEAAIGAFGVTEDICEAGFLLADGRMLDFSGKQQSNSGAGGRWMDHHQVEELLPGRDTTARGARHRALMYFCAATGAIRFGVNGGSINVDYIRPLTTAQRRRIEQALRAGRGLALAIDRHAANGDRLGSAFVEAAFLSHDLATALAAVETEAEAALEAEGARLARLAARTSTAPRR